MTSTYGNGVQIFKDVYDDKGRVSSQDDSLNSNKLTTFDYDEISEQGHILTTVTDRNGNKKVLTHDKNYNLLKVQDELGNIETYIYDNSGNRISETDENGNMTRYGYDDRGNLTSITDALGNTTKMTYDSNNNLLSAENSAGKKIVNTYDSNNNLLTAADVLGNVVTNTYDGNGQLLSTKNKNGALTKYSYKNGLLAVETDSLGNNTTYAYDAAGRKLKIIDASGKATSFEYDANGNTKTERSYVKGTAVQIDDASMTYEKDNRIAFYNGKNVIFDADGNMTSGPLDGKIADYKYDCRNRLISAGNTQYVYDALNNRIAVVENGTKTSYVINPNAQLSQLLVEKTADGKETYYVYGLGLISEETSDGEYRVYHFDKRASTTALTDKSGNITDRFQYDIYGKLVSHEGNSQTPFLYVGRSGVMRDSNGLYYMRARYYNADIKRFVNQDAVVGNIENGQSMNPLS